jgi:hypothetical protein
MPPIKEVPVELLVFKNFDDAIEHFYKTGDEYMLFRFDFNVED